MRSAIATVAATLLAPTGGVLAMQTNHIKTAEAFAEMLGNEGAAKWCVDSRDYGQVTIKCEVGGKSKLCTMCVTEARRLLDDSELKDKNPAIEETNKTTRCMCKMTEQMAMYWKAEDFAELLKKEDIVGWKAAAVATAEGTTKEFVGFVFKKKSENAGCAKCEWEPQNCMDLTMPIEQANRLFHDEELMNKCPDIKNMNETSEGLASEICDGFCQSAECFAQAMKKAGVTGWRVVELRDGGFVGFQIETKRRGDCQPTWSERLGTCMTVEEASRLLHDENLLADHPHIKDKNKTTDKDLMKQLADVYEAANEEENAAGGLDHHSQSDAFIRINPPADSKSVDDMDPETEAAGAHMSGSVIAVIVIGVVGGIGVLAFGLGMLALLCPPCKAQKASTQVTEKDWLLGVPVAGV